MGDVIYGWSLVEKLTWPLLMESIVFSNQKSFTFLLRWTIIIINFPQKLQEITLMIRVWWQRTRHLTQKILRLCWWDKEALQIRVGIEKRIETQLLAIKLWFLFWHLGGMLLWRNGFFGKLNLNKSVVLCLPFFLSYLMISQSGSVVKVLKNH